MYGNILKEETIKIPNVTCRKTKLVIELCRVIVLQIKYFMRKLFVKVYFE